TNKTEVSIKDMRRDALGGALDADQTRSLVESLTRSGWLRSGAAKPSGPKGGKPVRRWQVNPILWAAETAETAETSALKLCSEVSADSAVSAVIRDPLAEEVTARRDNSLGRTYVTPRNQHGGDLM